MKHSIFWLSIARAAFIRAGLTPSQADNFIECCTGDARDIEENDRTDAEDICADIEARRVASSRPEVPQTREPYSFSLETVKGSEATFKLPPSVARSLHAGLSRYLGQ